MFSPFCIIDVTHELYIYWSGMGSLVAIASEDLFYLIRMHILQKWMRTQRPWVEVSKEPLMSSLKYQTGECVLVCMSVG